MLKLSSNIPMHELESLDSPHISMPSRQQAVKEYVLASAKPTSDQRTVHLRVTKILSWRFAAIGVIASVFIMLLAISFQAFYGPSNNRVAALALVQKSQQASSQLSPDAQQALKKNMGVNIIAELRQAQAAQDLTLLTYTQVRRAYPYLINSEFLTPGAAPMQKQGTLAANAQALTHAYFLRFTDAAKRQVLIAVDSHDIPILFVDLSEIEEKRAKI